MAHWRRYLSMEPFDPDRFAEIETRLESGRVGAGQAEIDREWLVRVVRDLVTQVDQHAKDFARWEEAGGIDALKRAEWAEENCRVLFAKLSEMSTVVEAYSILSESRFGSPPR